MPVTIFPDLRQAQTICGRVKLVVLDPNPPPIYGQRQTITRGSGDHLRTIPSKFGPNSPSSFRGEYFKNIFPIGSYVKTMSVDIISLGWRVGSSDIILKCDHLRTLVPISYVVSEKILKNFPIGSCVQTMSVDVGGLG